MSSGKICFMLSDANLELNKLVVSFLYTSFHLSQDAVCQGHHGVLGVLFLLEPHKLLRLVALVGLKLEDTLHHLRVVVNVPITMRISSK